MDDGWIDGWMDGFKNDLNAVLRIAYSNKNANFQHNFDIQKCLNFQHNK